jgi:hypothetical protein
LAQKESVYETPAVIATPLWSSWTYHGVAEVAEEISVRSEVVPFSLVEESSDELPVAGEST